MPNLFGNRSYPRLSMFAPGRIIRGVNNTLMGGQPPQSPAVGVSGMLGKQMVRRGTGLGELAPVGESQLGQIASGPQTAPTVPVVPLAADNPLERTTVAPGSEQAPIELLQQSAPVNEPGPESLPPPIDTPIIMEAPAPRPNQPEFGAREEPYSLPWDWYDTFYDYWSTGGGDTGSSGVSGGEGDGGY